jgi:hypothetical protein
MFVLDIANSTSSSSTFNYEYWGFVVGIIGAVLAAFAIWITIRIFYKTQNIEREQQKNAEGLYVLKTKDYLRKIQNHFDQIFKTLENHDLTNDNDREIITQELNLYFRKYHGEMIKLLQNSERSLELWVNLEHTIRDKFDKVISDFDWLTSKFFPLNVEDDKTRITIWTTEYDAFLEKKYYIDAVLKKELKAEN